MAGYPDYSPVTATYEANGAVAYTVARTYQLACPAGGPGAGGLVFDCSAFFSRIVRAKVVAVLNDADGSVACPPGPISLGERGANTFATGKVVAVYGRINNYTPAGALAMNALGGAHVCAVGCDSSHPAATTVPTGAFNGTAGAISQSEMAGGSSWNTLRLVIEVEGVPR